MSQKGTNSELIHADRHNTTRRTKKLHQQAAHRAGRTVTAAQLAEELAAQTEYIVSQQVGNTGLTREQLDELTDHLVDKLTVPVKAKAQHQSWPTAVSLAAIKYMTSLIKGDGSVPEGLPELQTAFIQWEFAALCYSKVAKSDLLPGQSQDWYSAMADKMKEMKGLYRPRIPAFQPVKPTRSKPQASNTVNQPKPAATSETTGKPAKKAAPKPTLNGAAQHAQKARKHELVSGLDPEVDEFAYRGAHKLLAHFEALTKRELTTDNGGKIARTTEAEKRAFNDLDKELLSHEMAELRRGFEAAKDALNATFERTDGTKPTEPKPATAQPQQQPTLAVVPTPAQVFAQQPVSVAS